MELNEEQIACIRDIVENLETRNRNVALSRFFKDSNIFKDNKISRIFELYKDKMRSAQYINDQNLELEISRELNVSMNEVNSVIKYIDFISKKIDYELSAKYRNQYYSNRVNKLMDEQNKVRKKMECKTAYIKKGEVLRRQLDIIIKNYDEASKNGTLSKKKLRANINDIHDRVEKLGDAIEDRLVLAAMYADIGELDKCNSIISEYEYDKLSKAEKVRYKRARVIEINATNVRFIADLYKKGYSYENIKKECEKQAAGYRAGIIAKGSPKAEGIGLTLGFIKKVYNDLRSGQIKVNIDEDEKEL